MIENNNPTLCSTGTYTVKNQNDDATTIMQRLLDEGKITAREALVILQEIVSKKVEYVPSIPTYPTYPIIYNAPNTAPYTDPLKWTTTCSAGQV